MPAYPAIPFIADLNNINQTGPSDGLIRSSMDAGPVKSRRRFTASPRGLSGDTGIMTASQLDTFETWFDIDIAGGALSFTATHPRLLVTKTFRFTSSAYDIVTLRTAVTEYRVSMSLEMLP